MKLIDFERKGNVVRFYLGADDCNDYWGDDWNDAPYEHNAETVYDRYVSGYCDVAFPFDSLVLEPCNGTSNSHFSKDDMKKRVCPCVAVVAPEVAGENSSWRMEDYSYWAASGAEGVWRFYFNDHICDAIENGELVGGNPFAPCGTVLYARLCAPKQPE